MPTRNVVLTQHHEDMISGLVASGRYQNASEVMREGLRLIETREAEDEAKLTALRAAVQEGIDAMKHGDYVTFTDPESLTAYLNNIEPE